MGMRGMSRERVAGDCGSKRSKRQTQQAGCCGRAPPRARCVSGRSLQKKKRGEVFPETANAKRKRTPQRA